MPIGIVLQSVQHLLPRSSISMIQCGILKGCWSWSPIKISFPLGRLPGLSRSESQAQALSPLTSSCEDICWSCCVEKCYGRSIGSVWHVEVSRWITLPSWLHWGSCWTWPSGNSVLPRNGSKYTLPWSCNSQWYLDSWLVPSCKGALLLNLWMVCHPASVCT